MKSLDLSDAIEPGLGLALPEWIDRIEDIALDHGEFEPLGPDHSAILIENGSRLLVTFETVDQVRAQTNRDVPLGWALAAGHDWSQLCLLGHGETWFRHRAIFEYFDRLVDEGFFDDFDQVVFYGAEACGYAAASYSVAAPGATVLLFSPHATQASHLTEWDSRYPQARRIDFGGRYGFAPHLIEAAQRGFLFYDPKDPLDAMHASMFLSDNVARIRCPYFDGQIELFLERMDVLSGIVLLAMRGRLTPFVIARALRERRSYLPYLRRLMAAVERLERPFLVGLLCRSTLTRINAPRFRRQLAHAEEQLAAEGRRLPAPRMDRSA